VLRWFLIADPSDYDPEEDRPPSSDGSGGENSSSEDDEAVTEHYVAVGYVAGKALEVLGQGG